MRPNALPDSAVRRFTADLARCGISSADRLGICVSGGPDSLALLLLANASAHSIEAATVDHGLRREAHEEALFVKSLCADLNVRHEILTVAERPRGNMSEWARSVRYDRLRQWASQRSIDLLLTAHHADDQLETMLMRLNRGSGIAGLSGIRNCQPGVVRPLLLWRKSELVTIVSEYGIDAVADPSNSDLRFDRARLRRHLMHANWLDPVSASRSAQALAQANEALDWSADALFSERATFDHDYVSLTLPDALPHELVRRLVLRAIAKFNASVRPRGDALERLITNLEAGRTATLAGVKCQGGPRWQFSRAADRRTK